MLVFVWPAEAEVIYRPVDVDFAGTGFLKFDLNHDGVRDFDLHSTSKVTSCEHREGGLIGDTYITPAMGNGVVVSKRHLAAVLPSGVPIDDTSTFYNGQATVARLVACDLTKQVAGYLGLEFQIDGQTHYGWAQIEVFVSDYFRGPVMDTTLVGFAYETIPGQAIDTGQTSSSAYKAPPARDLPDYWVRGAMDTRVGGVTGILDCVFKKSEGEWAGGPSS